MITFEQKFITVVNETKKYFDIVSKLECAFDNIILQNMYTYPQCMFDLLEEESAVNWDDNIWDLIYSWKPEEALYQIKKLQLIADPFEENHLKKYKQKILDLLLAKGMMPYEAISLLDSRITERNVFDWKTKYPNIEALVEDLLIGRSDD